MTVAEIAVAVAVMAVAVEVIAVAVAAMMVAVAVMAVAAAAAAINNSDDSGSSCFYCGIHMPSPLTLSLTHTHRVVSEP